jgi:CelD/BcsL family acetyltransferase involved in cellulose biosynthesis
MAVLRSIQQLEAAADEWNRLADMTGHALLRHEWFLSAARTLHAGDSLTIVADRDSSGRMTAIAPLVAPNDRGMGRMEILGSAALHEPTGFLSSEARGQAELLNAALHLRRPMLLRRVLPSTLPDVGEGQSAGRHGLLIARQQAPCLGIELDATPSSFFERLSGKLRYDLRRARAKAEAVGPVVFDALAPQPSEVEALFEEFAAVEASGWKGRQGSSLAAKPGLRAFFRFYCDRTAEQGSVRFFRLRIGNAVAAVQMAVEIYSRLWILKIGYDEALAHCSPGLLLTAEAVRYALTQRLKSYEFLGGVEQWEERWKPCSRDHRFLVFYPWTVSGCVGVSLDAVGAGWRRVRRTAGLGA